jgi:hypothetical protein
VAHLPLVPVIVMGVTGPGQSQDTHPHSMRMTQWMLTPVVTGPGQSQDTHHIRIHIVELDPLSQYMLTPTTTNTG